MKQKLPKTFYLEKDVIKVAQELLGKVLVTKIGGIASSGIITETEAYAGETDKASHAYGGRRTKRTETMYQIGGTIYVYLCYGMHALFNVVTNEKEIPHAVLIRAIKPLEGIEAIKKRLSNRKMKFDCENCEGPSKVTVALGITLEHNNSNLQSESIFIEDVGIKVPKGKIIKSKRIGVDYAGADALLPYRFQIDTNILKEI